MHLSRVLGQKMPEIPLNEPDSQEIIQAYATSLLGLAQAHGYGRYLSAD
jgi:hypothetical protein